MLLLVLLLALLRILHLPLPLVYAGDDFRDGRGERGVKREALALLVDDKLVVFESTLHILTGV